MLPVTVFLLKLNVLSEDFNSVSVICCLFPRGFVFAFFYWGFTLWRLLLIVFHGACDNDLVFIILKCLLVFCSLCRSWVCKVFGCSQPMPSFHEETEVAEEGGFCGGLTDQKVCLIFVTDQNERKQECFKGSEIRNENKLAEKLKEPLES